MIEGYLECQGVKIHYVSNKFDSKKTSLLFVPGVMMPGWIWDKQLDHFSEHYNVVAIDPRSHGKSGQTSDGHDAFTMAKDIQIIVEELNLQKLVLIGWSIAVPQVVNYAVHFASEKLTGLVLVDGIVGVDSSWPFYQLMVEGWTKFQMNRPANTEQFIKVIFKQPHPESYMGKLLEIAMRMPTNTIMTLIYNYILQDFHALLPRIKIPAWIATIEGPRLDYMRKMQKLLSNSHFKIFPAAGHALFVDQPEEFNLSLENFLKTIE